jgi:hypothetical protein
MASFDWIDLGHESIGFLASLDRATGIALFAKDPVTAEARCLSYQKLQTFVTNTVYILVNFWKYFLAGQVFDYHFESFV